MTSHRPRRIAFVVGSFGVGGTEHFLVRMLRHLDRARFAPFVVTLNDAGPLRDEVRSLAPVYVVRLTGKLFNRRGLGELWRLARWMRRERIDLVHVVIERTIVYGTFAGRLAGLPVVASQRNTLSTMGRGLTALYFLSLRHLVRHIIPNADAIAAWLARQGVRRVPITVVHNGIPSARIRPFVERPPDVRPLTICTVGRLKASVKGQHLIFEALARLLGEGLSVRLVLVGSGPDEEMLRRRAAELGVAESVRWAGYLDDPTGEIIGSDICVLSSYTEGFPNALVEYLAAGRAVVATNVGGVREIIRPEDTGLLVPPGDAVALADALRRLIRDPGLRQRMGAAGRALVEAEFTADREAERTMDVYERVLERHRR